MTKLGTFDDKKLIQAARLRSRKNIRKIASNFDIKKMGSGVVEIVERDCKNSSEAYDEYATFR